MARTRSSDYDAIQRSILDRTADVFATRGYAASSIGDIAKACGCSKSRLYHYFDSKERILSTMLIEHVDQLLEGGNAVLQQPIEPIEKFRALLRFFLEIYAVSRSKHIAMLTCIDFLPDELRREVTEKQRGLITFVRDILCELRPEAAENRMQLHMDTMLFFGMINWTYTWYSAKGVISPDELADRSVSLFLSGFLNTETALPHIPSSRHHARVEPLRG